MALTSDDRPATPATEPRDAIADRGARAAPAPDGAANTPTPARAEWSAAEARQRWRITYARDVVPPDQVGRVALDAWQASVVAAALPVAGVDGDPSRPRLSFAAPLPAAARGEAELLDLWLVHRLPRWRVRDALAPCLPSGHRWLDAEDVWLGAPALPGQIVAADWRIEVAVEGDGVADRLREAASSLISARTIERTRMKGGAARQYDLRPLVAAIGIDAGRPLVVTARTRFDPERGSGRPEEIVAAVGDAAGVALEVIAMTRVRLWLAADLRAEDARGKASGRASATSDAIRAD